MLSELLVEIEHGRLPRADFDVTVVPPPSPTMSAVLSFTGTALVAADVSDAWVRERIAPGDLSAALNPPFLAALEAHLDRRVNSIDLVVLAPAAEGPPSIALEPHEDFDHPRVRRARRYRSDLRVWTTTGGVLTIGCGLTGRWEAAIEADPEARRNGVGRALADAARHLVPDGRSIWAQIAPGNSASVRTFLSAGYKPIGAEALLVP